MIRATSRLRPWVQGFAWVLLSIYFLTPAREAFDHSLDKSNYATYAHFLSHGFKWGGEVMPMTGPFGFILYGHTYTGELYWIRVLGDLLLKLGFVALLLHLFRRAAPGSLRWVWLIGVIVVVPMVDDLFHDFAILLATLTLLTNIGQRISRWSLLATLMLGALALFKGTHLITTGLCFSAVLMLGALERQWRQMIILTALYLGTVAACWLIAGQNLLHLPVYVRSVLELSSGYNATMGLDELPFIRTAGFVLTGGLVAVLGWLAVQNPRHSRLAVTLLLLAGFSFIKWKHGFLRADGHVVIFFASASVIVLTASLAAFTPLLGSVPVVLSGWPRIVSIALVTAVTGFAVLGSAEFFLQRVQRIPQDMLFQFQRNFFYLAHPRATRAKLDAELKENRREARVPEIQNEIGQDTVDFFGFEQGLLLLHGFNYHPRPMGGGSFNVFTPWLQEQNEAFVRDNRRAPLWEVLKWQTIDDRLPSSDDPLTFRAILDNYSPVLMQLDFLLLKRRGTPTANTTPVLLEKRHFKPGEIVVAPNPGAGHLLFFSLDAPYNWYGRLRSFFYRPPELTARIVSRLNPRGEIFALRPIMLHHPVELSPLLRNNSDVIKLWSNSEGNTVHSLQIETADGFDPAGLTISFFSAPRPPKAEEGDIAEILTGQEIPLQNRTPIQQTPDATGIHELNEEPITMIHAPSSVTWALTPSDRELDFSFGLMPLTYTQGGQTDGVEFNVELLWPPNDGRVIFRRLLVPVTAATDRGLQHARVVLPPFEPGAQLRIRTHPGPNNDGAFDQSFVNRIKFKSGPVTAEQFSGLGVIPADGRLPHLAVASIGSRPVFLVHAPNELTLNLPPRSAEMTCEIGLLPSAYENGGNTDGVAFAFDALLPDGSKRRLLDRFLDPVHQATDRGPQRIQLALPALPPGTQLLLSTGIGPHNDRSWDQSYVAGISFRQTP